MFNEVLLAFLVPKVQGRTLSIASHDFEVG